MESRSNIEQPTIKCKNHLNMDADYQFLKKGTPKAFYLCIDCYDDFDESEEDYSIVEISSQNVENLAKQIKSLVDKNKNYKNRISSWIKQRNDEFKKLIEKASRALIDLINTTSENFLNYFDGFSSSNFISNYDSFINQINQLEGLLNEHGKEFNDQSYMIRE